MTKIPELLIGTLCPLLLSQNSRLARFREATTIIPLFFPYCCQESKLHHKPGQVLNLSKPEFPHPQIEHNGTDLTTWLWEVNKMRCVKTWHVEGVENMLVPAFQLFSALCFIFGLACFCKPFIPVTGTWFYYQDICHVWNLEINATELKYTPHSCPHAMILGIWLEALNSHYLWCRWEARPFIKRPNGLCSALPRELHFKMCSWSLPFSYCNSFEESS